MTKIDLATLSIPGSDDRWFELGMTQIGIACISASDELCLFDSLEESSRSATDIAWHLQLNLPTITSMCLVLQAMGLLQETGEGFGLAEAARVYWLSASPFYRGGPQLRARSEVFHQRIIDSARTHSALMADEKHSFSEMWESGSLSIPAAQSFTDLMHKGIFAPALAAARCREFTGIRHLVDAGGGSGIFASAFVAFHPESQATLFEVPAVCEVASSFVRRYRACDRVSFFPGNFFQGPWPSGCDGFYFSNVFHNWPPDKCLKLATDTFQALPPHGKIFLHEVLLNDDKTSPALATHFDLMMRINFGAQQFTLAELDALLGKAGFINCRIVHRFDHYSLVVADKP